ncbi:MAG TPA: response regulator [Nitrososphaeraceae archaeon]
MILIVDDDYDIASLVKISLEKAGLFVSSFTDPLLALEKFRSDPSIYNLVISDIRMPHMNGYEFVQQVKKLKPNLKIILMSAFEFSDLEISSEIDDFLEKPISLRRLNEIVLRYVEVPTLSRKSYDCADETKLANDY